MRANWIAVCVAAACLIGNNAPGQEGAPVPKGAKEPEDVLLEAELLEVSTGDLERAKAVYEALSRDEKTPEPVRARALLYLARSHRKLGEIEAARKLLESLVKRQNLEREVLRQAQSFLRELQGGKASSPDFDWLKELERNPEIQSRVFDLAMDLVDTSSDAGKRARRQLLALGAVAVPVVERVIETTRDPRHKQNLALVLLQSGKFERLETVLDPQLISARRGGGWEAFEAFLEAIPHFSEDARGRLREAAAKLPSKPVVEPYRDAVLVRAGDASDLPKRLAHLESIWPYSFFRDLLEREPAAAAAIAERALDPELPREWRKFYVGELLERRPELIGAGHLLAFKGWNDDLKPFYAGLEKRGSWDILRELAGAGAVNYFGAYMGPDRIASAPVEWAKILRGARSDQASQCLRFLAQANDGALDEYVAFLRSREKEVPEVSNITGFWELNPRGKMLPSPRHLEAMAGLLDSKDPVVLNIAFDALQFATPETPAAVLEPVEKLARENGDYGFRVRALEVLGKRLLDHPEEGNKFSRLLLGELERGDPTENTKSSGIRLLRRGSGGPPPIRAGQTIRSAVRLTAAPSGGQKIMEILGRLDARILLLTYPHVFDLAGTESGANLHALFFQVPMPEEVSVPLVRVLVGKLETIQNKAFLESVAENILPQLKYNDDEKAPVEAFLKRVVLDRNLKTDARFAAFTFRFEQSLEWIDARQFLGGDDPLAESICQMLYVAQTPDHKHHLSREKFYNWLKRKGEEERWAIYHSAFKSPQKEVRLWALRNYPIERPDLPEIYGRLLEDPVDEIRNATKSHLENLSRADLAPLFLKFLGDPRKDYRIFGIEAVKRFALADAVKPLVVLLDDPDTLVRTKALEALKSIRQTLEEKKEWQRLVQGLPPSPSPAPSPPPTKEGDKKS